MERKKDNIFLTFQSGDLNPWFSVIFPPMIWILMWSEEPEIKSKQASKRDRTLTETRIPSEINPLLIKSYKENNTDMDLAMVIMEFKNSDVYARVKLLGDTELKVPTQFVLQVIFNEIDALFHQLNQNMISDCP